jgi:uncharacterized membrane protein (DUF4010 family)
LLARQPAGSAVPAVAGRAFNVTVAIGFAIGVTVVSTATAWANQSWGRDAATAAAAMAGAFDVHAAAASALSLVADGKLAESEVALPVLLAFSSNTVMKWIAAFGTGGRAFGVRVAAGLALIAAAAWLPFAFG